MHLYIIFLITRKNKIKCKTIHMCNLFVVEDDPSLFIRKMGKTILSNYIITKYALNSHCFVIKWFSTTERHTACVVKLFITFKIIASSHSERLMVFWLKLHTLGSDQYTHTCIQNSSSLFSPGQRSRL